MASALWKQNLSEDQGWDSLANSAAFYSAVLTTTRAMLWARVRAERSRCKEAKVLPCKSSSLTGEVETVQSAKMAGRGTPSVKVRHVPEPAKDGSTRFQ